LNALTRKPPPLTVVPIVAPASERLASIERYVQQAPIGERNMVCFWGACRAGEMVRGGAISPRDAVATVARAGIAAGLDEIEAWRTAKSGVRQGAAAMAGGARR